MIRVVLLLLCCTLQSICMAQGTVPQPVEGDAVVKNFRFRSGEVLPEVRLHYRTSANSNVMQKAQPATPY